MERLLWETAFGKKELRDACTDYMDLHPEVNALMEQADPTQSPAAWALRYAASPDGVSTVLSGMSTIGQMQENYKIMSELSEFAQSVPQSAHGENVLLSCHHGTSSGGVCGLRFL